MTGPKLPIILSYGSKSNSRALGGPGRGGNAGTGAGNFVSDGERNRETPAEVLGRRYGLTPAEARLAEAIVGGDRLSEAAERFGVTLGTVRIQLKAIFAKTGARSQADLVRLALTGAASPGDGA